MAMQHCENSCLLIYLNPKLVFGISIEEGSYGLNDS